MTEFTLIVGILAIVLGITSLLLVLLRSHRRAGAARRKAVVDGLFASGLIAVGLYLVLGLDVFLVGFGVLVVGGWAVQRKVASERGPQAGPG